MERRFHLASELRLVAVASVLLLDCDVRGASDFKEGLLAPGPISDAGWNADAYDGLTRTGDVRGAQVSYGKTRTPAEFEEGFHDLASGGCRLVFGHRFEVQDGAAMVGDEFPNTVFITTSGSTVRASVPPRVFGFEEGTHRAGLLGRTRSPWA